MAQRVLNWKAQWMKTKLRLDLQSQMLLAELRVQRQLLVLQVLRKRHREELDLGRICSLWYMRAEVSSCRRATCRDCTSSTSNISAERGR